MSWKSAHKKKKGFGKQVAKIGKQILKAEGKKKKGKGHRGNFICYFLKNTYSIDIDKSWLILVQDQDQDCKFLKKIFPQRWPQSEKF